MRKQVFKENKDGVEAKERRRGCWEGLESSPLRQCERPTKDALKTVNVSSRFHTVFFLLLFNQTVLEPDLILRIQQLQFSQDISPAPPPVPWPHPDPQPALPPDLRGTPSP